MDWKARVGSSLSYWERVRVRDYERAKYIILLLR